MSVQRPRVLVVEDEDLARDRLARLVGADADFEFVAACRNGEEALSAVQAESVDVMLLDIQMPGIDGMDVQRRLSHLATPPLVVFVTAHPVFAVDAFASEAVDYVLKPVDSERLRKALHVARERLRAREAIAMTHRIRAAIDDIAGPAFPGTPPVPGQMLVRQNGRLRVLPHEHIDWIQARGRTCVVYCGDKHYPVNGPLTELAERLHDTFVRVGRSALVNIARIEELHEMFKGDLIVVMKNRQEIRIGRRFRGEVLRRLGTRQSAGPRRDKA